MGDEAGALVRSRRATERVGGRRHDDRAAVLHTLELSPQKVRLSAGLPGVRHPLRRALVVARQRVEADVDARSKDEPIVVKARAVAQRQAPGLWVDLHRALMHDGDASLPDSVIAELLLAQRAQARDHVVAERASSER